LEERFVGNYSLVKQVLAFRVANTISISEVLWLALMSLLTCMALPVVSYKPVLLPELIVVMLGGPYFKL
jgi:hypothetical protein